MSINPISDVLVELSRAGVRFVVVGGVAAVMQGVERVTYDLDLVIELTRESCLKAIERLLAIGYRAKIPADPRGFADESIRESWIRDKGMMVFSFWDASQRRAQVDIFVRYPLDFENLWTRATKVLLDDVEIRLASPLVDQLLATMHDPAAFNQAMANLHDSSYGQAFQAEGRAQHAEMQNQQLQQQVAQQQAPPQQQVQQGPVLSR